jgi:hemolysin activation/secretion protein
LDLTLSHPLGRMLHRDLAAAITAGAGTSAGTIPVQRLWYLGGTSTIRGEPAGSMAGDSYWLTHTELGYGSAGMRRIAFFDLGWAGDRTRWRDVGRPASGVGVGASLLDGLIRFDIARGLYPTPQWHTALYLEARF